MIKKVRKWVNLPKKPNSFEERMKAQPNTFDIIKTQYSTDAEAEAGIQVFDDLPVAENELIVRRSGRLKSVEMVQNSSASGNCANLSLEEQETLDMLNSAFEDHDDVVEDHDHVSVEKSNNVVMEDNNTINYDAVVRGSRLSSTSSKDNWSLEKRSQTSSGRFRMVQKNMYLPETSSRSDMDVDEDDFNHNAVVKDEILVFDDGIEGVEIEINHEISNKNEAKFMDLEIPELPTPDYPEEGVTNEIKVETNKEQNDNKNITNKNEEKISKPEVRNEANQVEDVSKVDGNDVTKIPVQKTKISMGIVRGTSFNSPMGRAKLQIKTLTLKDDMNSVTSNDNTNNESAKAMVTESETLKLEARVKDPTKIDYAPKTNINPKSPIANHKTASGGQAVKTISSKIPVTGFTRGNDTTNNNYTKAPIVTSFKAQKDKDLEHLEHKKPVNNLVRKFETITN